MVKLTHMRPNRIAITLIVLAAIFLTACTGAVSYVDPDEPADTGPTAAEINAAADLVAAEDSATSSPTETSPADPPATESSPTSPPNPTEIPADETAADDGPAINRRVEVPEVRVNWLLPWDAIRPVYNPEFATAEEAPLDDDELVLGISIGGESKAYPITVLNFREMVNDEMAGIPTLVTW